MPANDTIGLSAKITHKPAPGSRDGLPLYGALENPVSNEYGGPEILVDGITRIDIVNGIIRITLATYRGGKPHTGEPLHVVITGRLAMQLNVAEDFRQKLTHMLGHVDQMKASAEVSDVIKPG